MNAALIADLESIKGKLDLANYTSTNETVSYEITLAKRHVERAIEWEKDRP